MAYTEYEENFAWLRSYFRLKPVNNCEVGTRGFVIDVYQHGMTEVSTERFCAVLRLCRKAFKKRSHVFRDEKRGIAVSCTKYGELHVQSMKKDFFHSFNARDAERIESKLCNDFRWIQKVKYGTVKRNKWVTNNA